MKKDCYQKTLFDDIDTIEQPKKKEITITLSNEICTKFQNYNLEDYIKDIEVDGLSYTWTYICEYVLTYGENTDFLNIRNFGEMYEIGLALQDKIQKKKQWTVLYARRRCFNHE